MINYTKKDSIRSLFYGADSGNMLQPLVIFIAQELKNIPIEEMRCCV